MWEVYPISQTIHWEGELLLFFFYRENSDKELLNLCLLLAVKLSDPTTSEQVQWKLCKPGVKTRIILAHINTKKCHIEIREFREIIGFSNKLASPLVMFRDSSE